MVGGHVPELWGHWAHPIYTHFFLYLSLDGLTLNSLIKILENMYKRLTKTPINKILTLLTEIKPISPHIKYKLVRTVIVDRYISTNVLVDD